MQSWKIKNEKFHKFNYQSPDSFPVFKIMYSRTKCCLSLADPFSFRWLVLMLCLITKNVAESPVEDEKLFSDPFNEFNHLVVDKDRGWVFIGAVNRLYQLFPDLRVNKNLSTIPIFDSSRTEDNYNKILVLDYENSRLISCGSLFQGYCEIYKIFKDSMDQMPPKLEPVTASNPKTSTVAFIIPDPIMQGNNNNKKTPALCVAVTYTKNNPEIPAIATRSLEEKKSFQVIKSNSSSSKSDSSFPTKAQPFSTGAQISFNSSYLDKYIVNYVYGFSSESYSYFLTTQMKSAQSSPYISRLIRICQRDENYNSYTEIPIECAGKDGKVYNLVQAAFIIKPSSELAKSLGITTQDDVLFGIFSKSKEPLSNEPSCESALCMYSLKAINDKFTENIQNCYLGKGDRGLEYILPKEKCSVKSSSLGSCGIALNLPFGGEIPVKTTPLIAFDKLLTAITAVSQTDFTLVIVGAYSGYLQMFALINTTTAWKLKDIALNETSSVNSDLQFDKNNEYLYAMTKHLLTRIKFRDHLPSISYISPDRGPWEGGTNVTIGIKNFGNLFIGNHLEIKIAGIPCISYEHDLNSSEIVCSTTNSNASKVHDGQIEVFINGIRVANGTKFKFVDPKISKVSFKELTTNTTNFTIEGEHLNAGNSISVIIGNVSCQIFSNQSDKIQCNANLSAANIQGQITVKIDESIRMFDIPREDISKPTVIITSNLSNFWQSKIAGIPTMYLLLIPIIGLLVLTFIIIATCCFHRRKFSVSTRKMQERMNKLELCVAAECKEAFAELQTEMTHLTAENLIDGLPFFNYRAYVMKNLFPEMENNCLFLNESSSSVKTPKLLDSLIKNKTFLLTFIRTLENNKNFSMKNRVYIASVLMITLHNNIDYGTDILETLLADLIAKYTQGKSHPKLLLRGTESVVEKMLSIWFTFLLYDFLRECAGEPLFKLFTAMKQHINKGPVDMITSEARYSLNQEKLIRHHIDYHSITINVSISQQTAMVIGLKSAKEKVPVTVLDCDTITQVKEKALDVIFRSIGHSKCPDVSKLELKWMSGTLNGKILYDNDTSSKVEGEWKRKNTLHHYGVPDGAKFTFISMQHKHYHTLSTSSDESFKKTSEVNTRSLLRHGCVKPQLSGSESLLIRDNESYFREWHLIKPYNADNDCAKNSDSYKMVSEIYLTRVLATKVTLQRYVDDLFQTILMKTNQNDCFPTAIKYIFDFLDDQAMQRGITDPEVVHTWKNNCLPLRFWVNLIKNPNFLFDVHKSDIIDSSLSVVAQAFMDSCSTADHNLGKDSPTTKLLYAKDIPTYKKWVKKYYGDIKAMYVVSRKHAKIMFAKELLRRSNDFNTNASSFELYKYMKIYKNELMTALRDDKVSQRYLLADKFEELMKIMAIDYNS